MTRIVVDTSVLVKWFKRTDEDLVEQADALLAEIEARQAEVHVPSLLLYEIGNVFLLKSRLNADEMDEAFLNLEQLPLVVAPPAAPLLAHAGRLGRELDLTFYDASFLALAVELDCAFVTADRRLFERVRSRKRVRHLSRTGPLE